MKENLLQYLWNYKLFSNIDFKDAEGNSIEILDFGTWNTDSGPDFLMAKIKINNVIFAGNIELHVRSSDWIFHQHSADPNYENIILHAVYINDAEIEELNQKKIPTLELQYYIDQSVISKYEKMLSETVFIPCEKVFDIEKIPFHFYEETLIQKLENKSSELEISLKNYKNNYEALLFHSISYAFGLKVNAEIFRQIAQSIDFGTVQKVRQNRMQLEALFFGIAGWLENPEDAEMLRWKTEFEFLKVKYKIPEIFIRPKFLRLRPPNFPTIRLSQLAHLYHQHANLFSKVISAKKAEFFYTLFNDISASEYWDSHFNFGKVSPVLQPKVLTKEFQDLIIINAFLPIKYLYERNQNENTADEILHLYSQISPEKNSIIASWKNLGLKTDNALQTQSLVYHYRHNCSAKKCLHCSIGFKILKENG
ncbi:hypothetical protein ASG01_07155 [Chryseobacterium sp. Leaf180]|uniref:DUF2851 family protein n=1 Tax=Chryseobacterium sp. Leaf180 TaxID=1736289 RepID=UPI0006FC142F|nr:DUF2851 family protein [Chryseobacterium sp. Leaf180]KQR95612.1 hypothetical protein ASG01_07155 [Chryseobacterium sp. Leaf180]